MDPDERILIPVRTRWIDCKCIDCGKTFRCPVDMYGEPISLVFGTCGTRPAKTMAILDNEETRQEMKEA